MTLHGLHGLQPDSIQYFTLLGPCMCAIIMYVTILAAIDTPSDGGIHNLPIYNPLDDGVVFHAHGRVLGEYDIIAALDARHRRDLDTRHAALRNEGHPDREENARVIAPYGELERPRLILGVDKRDVPVE